MATRTRKPAPAQSAPEVDLSDLLDREPSDINKAEAAWLVDCVGLEVTEEDMPLVERIVYLVAGKAHREWQKSETAAELHNERAERAAAAKSELAERRAAKSAAKDEDDGDEPAPKARRGRPRKVVVEDEDEEAPAPAPKRRGRPASVKAAPAADEDETPAPKRRVRAARKGGSEAPF